MILLQIHHIELALHKAILEMDKSGKTVLPIFRSRHTQLYRAKDKNEWANYDSLIPRKYQRNILYEFFCEEAKFLLMLEN